MSLNHSAAKNNKGAKIASGTVQQGANEKMML